MKKRAQKIPRFFSGCLVGAVIMLLLFPFSAQAAHTANAAELYEKGKERLSAYQGNPAALAESRKLFAQIIDKFPNSPYGYLGLSRCYLVEAYQSGENYSIPKIKENVLPYASKAMRLGPLLNEVHEYSIFLGEILDRHTAQQEIIQQQLALFPDQANTYRLIGNYFYDREDYALAAQSYQKAALMPASEKMHRQILMRLGWLYLEHFSEPEQAIEYYKEALAGGEKSAAVYQFLGMAYLEQKNYLSAAEYFKKAKALASTPLVESYALQTEGYISEQNGEFARAIKLLQDAAAINAEQGALLYALGSIFYKLSDYGNAYQYFTKVIRMESLTPEAYYYAGRSAQSLGDKAQALDYYRQYLQMDSEGEEARWIRANVPELSYK